MGRVGACGDNAAMESFFALLQNNVLDRQRWATPRNNYGWRLSPGSKPPTMAGADNAASANSHPSSLRQSNPSHSRPEPPNPASQLNPGQSRMTTLALVKRC